VGELLIEAHASVNAVNMLGETPLILAVRNSADVVYRPFRLELVNLFIENNANVNMSDAVLHETPLMEAAGIDDEELISLLLQAKADPLRSSASGKTALSFASSSSVQQILQLPAEKLEKRWQSLPKPTHPTDIQGPIAFVSAHGTYLASNLNGYMSANRESIGFWEMFGVVLNENTTVSLKTHFSRYVTVSEDGEVFADQIEVREPEMIYWLRNNDRTVSLRSCHGKYLSIDECGVVRARSETIGVQEMFHIVTHVPGQLQSEKAGSQQTRWGAPASGTFPAPSPPQAPAQKPPPTPEELRDELFEEYPGFATSGVKLPQRWREWNRQELELYMATMGDFWPPTQPRDQQSSSSPKAGNLHEEDSALPPKQAHSKFPPSDIKRYCEVLGVPSSLKDPIALKRAYRQAALKWHPDKNAGNKSAAEKFLEVAQAYNSLCLHLEI